MDYLLVAGGNIHPVEVKSGAEGKLKSLHLQLKSHPDDLKGYEFSCASYSELSEQRLFSADILRLYFRIRI